MKFVFSIRTMLLVIVALAISIASVQAYLAWKFNGRIENLTFGESSEIEITEMGDGHYETSFAANGQSRTYYIPVVMRHGRDGQTRGIESMMTLKINDLENAFEVTAYGGVHSFNFGQPTIDIRTETKSQSPSEVEVMVTAKMFYAERQEKKLVGTPKQMAAAMQAAMKQEPGRLLDEEKIVLTIRSSVAEQSQ